MTKPPDHEADRELDAQGRRRVRLRPRTGSEHRFAFARRWEARRKARSQRSIWALVGLDFGLAILVFLILQQVLGRLGTMLEDLRGALGF